MENSEWCFERLLAGDADGVRQILQKDPKCAEARDASGVSLVMQSLYRGQRELAATIADRKTLDIFEASALGRLERLKELIRDKATVNSRSSDGFTALHFAGFFGQPEAARLLIQAGAAVDAVAANPMKVMPMHSAASARNLETVRLLLEHGAPPNARQEGGWAPIHSAAQNGDRAIVDLLLKHGADTKATNDQGKTASMVARERGHEEIAALLG